MKRVVCFDLWGTLLESAYRGETYEEYLSRWGEQHRVRAMIRTVLLTCEARHDGEAVSALLEHRPLTYNEAYEILFKRLFPVRGRNVTTRQVFPDPQRVQELWQAENEAARFIPGAVETLARLENDFLVLVTNTSEPGWWHVERKLNVSRCFDKTWLSFEHPAAKPDPSVWEAIRGQTSANEYWMIGNESTFDLVVPAAMGWRTILVGKQGVAISAIPEIIDG